MAVRGLRERLPHASGGKQGGAGQHGQLAQGVVDSDEAAPAHAAFPHDQVLRTGERSHADAGSPLHLLQQRTHHLPSCGVSQGVQNPVARMGRLACELHATGVAIEARAPGHQLTDALQALLDQDARRLGGDDPGAGAQGVLQMQARVVVLGESHGHAALGVGAVALGRLVLCDDEY
jgi:hypothetical protein